MSTELVMPSNHLILCHPFLLPHSIFLSIRVFSSESVLRIRWPKYWSFSFSIRPSNEYSGLISSRIDWFDLLITVIHQGACKTRKKSHLYLQAIGHNPLYWGGFAIWSQVTSEAPVLFLGDDFSKQWLPDPWGNIPESWDWQEVYLAMKMNDTHLKRTEKEIVEEKGRKGGGKVSSLIFNRENRASFFFSPSCGTWDLSSPTRDQIRPPTMEAWSFNCWTTNEAPSLLFLMRICPYTTFRS